MARRSGREMDDTAQSRRRSVRLDPMDPVTLHLLKSADDPVNAEAVPGFDWEGEMARTRALKPEIERIAGRPFELHDGVEDPTHFAELSLVVPGETRNEAVTVLGVRFSGLGRLFTTWGIAREKLPEPVVARVIEAVRAA